MYGALGASSRIGSLIGFWDLPAWAVFLAILKLTTGATKGRWSTFQAAHLPGMVIGLTGAVT
jgi:hypothetical protein